MCWTMYLGSTIDPGRVDPQVNGRRRFGVVDVESAEEQALRGHLPFPFLRSLVSSGDCGCDFPTNRRTAASRDDRRRYDADRAALAEYLRSLGTLGAQVALYCCWAGELKRPCRLTRLLKPEQIAQRTFKFRLNELIDVQFAAQTA
jgi:hypothetical protein